MNKKRCEGRTTAAWIAETESARMSGLPNLSSLSLAHAVPDIGEEMGAAGTGQSVASKIIKCATRSVGLAFEETFQEFLKQPNNRKMYLNRSVYWVSVHIALACKYTLSLSRSLPHSPRDVDFAMNLILYYLFYVDPHAEFQQIEDDDATARRLAKTVRRERWVVDVSFMCISKTSTRSRKPFQNMCRLYSKLTFESWKVNWIRDILKVRDDMFFAYPYDDTIWTPRTSSWQLDDESRRRFYVACMEVTNQLVDPLKYRRSPPTRPGGFLEEDDVLGSGSFGTVYRILTKKEGWVAKKVMHKTSSKQNVDLETKSCVSTLITREIFLWYLLSKHNPSNYVAQILDVEYSLGWAKEERAGAPREYFVDSINFVSKLSVPFNVLLRSVQPRPPNSTSTDANPKIRPWFLQFAKQSIGHALKGLEHMKQWGVVHVDVKPANMVFSPTTGYVQLSDFGSARPYNKKAYGTTWNEYFNEGIFSKESHSVGNIFTFQYVAPEIAMGELGPMYKVTYASDCWSIGITTAELLHPDLMIKELIPPGIIDDKNPIHAHYWGIAAASLLTGNPLPKPEDLETASWFGALKNGEWLLKISKRYYNEIFLPSINSEPQREHVAKVYYDYLGQGDAESMFDFLKNGCLVFDSSRRKNASQLLSDESFRSFWKGADSNVPILLPRGEVGLAERLAPLKQKYRVSEWLWTTKHM